MWERLKHAIKAGRAAAAEAEAPLFSASEPTSQSAGPVTRPVSVPGQIETVSDVEPDPLLALLVLDEAGPATPELTRRHLEAAKSASTGALFIVGARSELDFFSDRTLLCEYLPSHEDIYRATEERADVIALYRQHRLRLIFDKWRVEDCRWVGDSAGELVARLQTEKDGAQRPIRFHKM